MQVCCSTHDHDIFCVAWSDSSITKKPPSSHGTLFQNHRQRPRAGSPIQTAFLLLETFPIFVSTGILSPRCTRWPCSVIGDLNSLMMVSSQAQALARPLPPRQARPLPVVLVAGRCPYHVQPVHLMHLHPFRERRPDTPFLRQLRLPEQSRQHLRSCSQFSHHLSSFKRPF